MLVKYNLDLLRGWTRRPLADCTGVSVCRPLLLIPKAVFQIGTLGRTRVREKNLDPGKVLVIFQITVGWGRLISPSEKFLCLSANTNAVHSFWRAWAVRGLRHWGEGENPSRSWCKPNVTAGAHRVNGVPIHRGEKPVSLWNTLPEVTQEIGTWTCFTSKRSLEMSPCVFPLYSVPFFSISVWKSALGRTELFALFCTGF